MTRPYHWRSDAARAVRVELARARLRRLHADPAFAAAHAARTSARMRTLHADPAHNPLAGLTAAQKRFYKKLRGVGFARAEAVTAARSSPK